MPKVRPLRSMSLNVTSSIHSPSELSVARGGVLDRPRGVAVEAGAPGRRRLGALRVHGARGAEVALGERRGGEAPVDGIVVGDRVELVGVEAPGDAVLGARVVGLVEDQAVDGDVDAGVRVAVRGAVDEREVDREVEAGRALLLTPMHSDASRVRSGLLGSARNLVVLAPYCRQLRSNSPATTLSSNHSPKVVSVSLALGMISEITSWPGAGDRLARSSPFS